MHKRFVRAVAFMLLMMIVLAGFGQTSLVADAVTVSNVGYNVYVNGSNVFLCNERTAGSEIGTEYYMTYTVKKVIQNPIQHGLIGTADYTRAYPYDEGGLLRGSNDDMHMLDEGATYFIKMTVAEGGFRYNITRAKDNDTENLYMEFVYGKATDKMQYFGLWLGEGGVHAELTNVHCYDVDGNDLGIRITLGRGLVLNADKRLENDTEIDHRYDITINNQANIAISNLKKPTTSKVYMEYEVETAEYSFNQEGIALSNKPEADYPYTNGILQHNNYDANDNQIMLLEVGAKYIIYMERTKAGLDVYVQKMKDGMRTIHVFPLNFVSNTKETFEFFSLWFGDSKLGSFKLTNFKCYDANKNNLGVQCNRKAEIQHFGLMEDYAGCEATYYCKETENSFALYSDQQLKFTENNSTQDGIYAISENVMTAKIGEDTKKYSYLFKRITDEDGRKYDRLYKYTVTFVTGTSEKIAVQNLSNEHGYFAMKPDEPKLEGYEFEGWCLIDGTFFDFDKIVTESTTLYAKYSGDGGITFLAGAEEENTSGVEIPDIVWVVAGIILLFIGSVICILFIRKGYKNGRINRN